jgi:hypothetical protein
MGENMRARIGSLIVLAVLVVALTASSAFADSGTLRLRADQSNYSADNGGGEFRVIDLVDTGGHIILLPSYATDPKVQVAADGDFQTFCIERNEFFNPNDGNPYTWDLNSQAIFGGKSKTDPYASTRYAGDFYGDSGTGDILCPETAWLFTEFFFGTLSYGGYAYDYDEDTAESGDRTSSAKQLQLAIWFLEGEDVSYASLTGAAKAWVDYAHALYVAKTITDIGKVGVLNLYYANGTKAQDQLVMLDTSVFEVPLPPAAPLGLALLGVIGLYSRIRRRMRRE